MRFVASLAVVPLAVAVLAWPLPLFAEPPPLTKNDFTLEVSQGPVTTASRIVGLGGAYTALAEWCEGAYANAASPAMRAPYSLNDFDYDVCLGLMMPGAFGGTDFENRPPTLASAPSVSRFQNSVNVNLGLQLLFGNFGVTVDWDGMTLGVDDKGLLGVSVKNGAAIRLDRITGSVAWALADGQFLIGVGTRALISGVKTSAFQLEGFTGGQAGAGLQLGAIFRPNGAPYRFGFTYRDSIHISEVKGAAAETRPDGTQVAGGLVMPQSIAVPLEVEGGVALDFGPRPLNPEWINPSELIAHKRKENAAARAARAAEYEDRVLAAPPAERERLRLALMEEERQQEKREDEAADRAYRELAAQLKKRASFWSRRGITLHGSVIVMGNTPGAVGISSYLAQRREPYGSFVTVSPRFGFETEVIPYWLTMRGGTYLEPSRFEDGTPRVHGTAGADVATVPWTAWGLFGDNPWRLRLAFDGAPRYTNFAIAIGQYH